MTKKRQSVDLQNSSSMGKNVSSAAEIAQFVTLSKEKAKGVGEGRLVFALDATMSRQPMWDRACTIQSDMFLAANAAGELSMQLVYFRGIGECAASKWLKDGKTLGRLMNSVSCRGGSTQIRKVLSHTIQEGRRHKISALVYIGDCVEEDVDLLCARAGDLRLLGTPAFMFHEGFDAHGEMVFREIARLTKGAYVRFDDTSAAQLGALLQAVAIYAAGGQSALERLRTKGDRSAQLLLARMS